MKKDKPNPVMVIESRPSRVTGISWWLVLSYKDFEEARLLPFGFMDWDPGAQALAIAPMAEEMRLKLKPILDAEDAQLRLIK